MHRRGILLGLLLSLAAAVLGAAPARALEVGRAAPDFTLTAPGNHEVKLADLLGNGTRALVIYTFIQAFNGV